MSTSKARKLLYFLAALAFRIPEKLRPCDWMKKHVEIPAITGSLEPGPLDTSRCPPIEGLHDLLFQRHVRFITIPKSGRVGGTLFCICVILHEIDNAPGPILWVDPSRGSARQFFRRELEPFLLACPPVARQAIRDREHWTASQVFFRNGTFIRIAGAGSPNELAGFQARVIVINEGDKVHHTTRGEAPAHELAIVRSKQFRRTRKIIEQSTPTDEHGPTWTRFLRGTQHHCYLPCPHCSEKKRLARLLTAKGRKPQKDWLPSKHDPGRSPSSYDPDLAGWQRLTFESQTIEVPFDIDLQPLPKGQTRTETTGYFSYDHCRTYEKRQTAPGVWEDVPSGHDLDSVVADTRYRCQHCGQDIAQPAHFVWMLHRYRWIPHNPRAPRDHISAHIWAALSPWEIWGDLAKKRILAGHHQPGPLHDFHNNDLGLPYKLIPTEVDESDILRLVNASPSYVLGTLPHQPLMLSMTIDVQDQASQHPFWWMIWAWGIHWDRPGWPTWAALIDYGSAMSWDELDEKAGLRPLPKRHDSEPDQFHHYTWKGPSAQGPTGDAEPEIETSTHSVDAGLVDSGDQAQSDADVYGWIRSGAGAIFSPSKGGGRNSLAGHMIKESVIDKDTPDEIPLILYRSDYFAQKLYRLIIKERRFLRYLPRDIDAQLITQLQDEHTEWDNGKLVWRSKAKNNHLGDTWKMTEVLSGTIEEQLDSYRVAALESGSGK